MGLPYDLHMLCFPPRVNNKAFLDDNPLGTVPFLRDGPTEMTESCAMLTYLGARYDTAGCARGPDHADYGAYLNWLFHGEATLTFPLTIALRYARFEPDERKLPQAVEDYQAWFQARLRKAEATLADGRAYLLPPGFSLADISVAYAVQLAITMGLRDQLPPNVRRWFGALTERPAFQRTREIEERAHLAAGYPERAPVILP
jgi:glutathione S-transferase